MKKLDSHSSGPLTSAISPQLLSSKIRKAFSRGPWALFVMLLSVSLLLQSQSLNAQAPQQFSFQGVARDATGKIISNTTIAYSFTIHQGATDGTIVYQNEGLATTNSAGVFNTTVGTTGSPLPSNIQWGADKFFLQVGIDPDGTGGSGIFFTDLGATQLISVPYAMYSSESGKWRDNAPIVQKGDLSLPQASLPNIGFGPTLIWHPKKAAFRAGYASANDWEEGGIGSYSFAAGYNPKATGLYSVSAGNSNQALAESTIAMGDASIANATYAIAVGKSNTASGNNSVSIGEGNIAGGDKSVSLGAFANASALGAISIGHNISSAATYCTTLGYYNNNGDVPNGSNTDRLFQIGNGTSGNRTNALTILKNGNVGIGTNSAVPTYPLDIDGRARIKHVPGATAGIHFNNSQNQADGFVGMKTDNQVGFYINNAWRLWVDAAGNAHCYWGQLATVSSSDIRLKKDLQPLKNSLQNLHRLNGYTYYWINPIKDKGKLQNGLIAQELEKVIPELVDENSDGYKTVNYIGLIPHLIEAVKELDKKTEEITALKKELASMQELNKKLSALEANVKMLLAGQAESSSQTSK